MINDFDDEDNLIDEEIQEIKLPNWQLYFVCQECGHKDIRTRPPQYKAYKCPKCKSESFMPQGF